MNKQPSVIIIDEATNMGDKPSYEKPKTSLFLETATNIESGANNVLESQGNGYLNS